MNMSTKLFHTRYLSIGRYVNIIKLEMNLEHQVKEVVGKIQNLNQTLEYPGDGIGCFWSGKVYDF